MKNNIAFIQARMESTRLPGKANKEICGYPMLDWVIEGLKYSKSLTGFGVIIPDSIQNNCIKQRYKKDYFVFSGSHFNVLDRYYKATLRYEHLYNIKIDNIIRITGDCPLLAYYPKLIDEVVTFHNAEKFDYVYNTGINRFPSGIDVEVMKRDILEYSWRNAIDDRHKEHVTLFARENMKSFIKIGHFKSNAGKFNFKWSIDDDESFKRVSDLMNFHIIQQGHLLSSKDKYNMLLYLRGEK